MSEPGQQGRPRRRLVMAGAAVLGVLAGAGAAWWGRRPAEEGGGAEALWPLSLQTPRGAPLDLSSLRGRPLLVNFWATWCPPCVEEMPLLDAFFRDHAGKGWQVVGLAVDQPSAVRTFLQRTPVSFPIAFAGLEGTALAKALGNQTGGLPFTVVVSADGSIRERRMGRVSEADLKAWASQS